MYEEFMMLPLFTGSLITSKVLSNEQLAKKPEEPPKYTVKSLKKLQIFLGDPVLETHHLQSQDKSKTVIQTSNHTFSITKFKSSFLRFRRSQLQYLRSVSTHSIRSRSNLLSSLSFNSSGSASPRISSPRSESSFTFTSLGSKSTYTFTASSASGAFLHGRSRSPYTVGVCLNSSKTKSPYSISFPLGSGVIKTSCLGFGKTKKSRSKSRSVSPTSRQKCSKSKLLNSKGELPVLNNSEPKSHYSRLAISKSGLLRPESSSITYLKSKLSKPKYFNKSRSLKNQQNCKASSSKHCSFSIPTKPYKNLPNISPSIPPKVLRLPVPIREHSGTDCSCDSLALQPPCVRLKASKICCLRQNNKTPTVRFIVQKSSHLRTRVSKSAFQRSSSKFVNRYSPFRPARFRSHLKSPPSEPKSVDSALRTYLSKTSLKSKSFGPRSLSRKSSHSQSRSRSPKKTSLIPRSTHQRPPNSKFARSSAPRSKLHTSKFTNSDPKSVAGALRSIRSNNRVSRSPFSKSPISKSVSFKSPDSNIIQPKQPSSKPPTKIPRSKNKAVGNSTGSAYSKFVSSSNATNTCDINPEKETSPRQRSPDPRAPHKRVIESLPVNLSHRPKLAVAKIRVSRSRLPINRSNSLRKSYLRVNGGLRSVVVYDDYSDGHNQNPCLTMSVKDDKQHMKEKEQNMMPNYMTELKDYFDKIRTSLNCNHTECPALQHRRHRHQVEHHDPSIQDETMGDSKRNEAQTLLTVGDLGNIKISVQARPSNVKMLASKQATGKGNNNDKDTSEEEKEKRAIEQRYYDDLKETIRAWSKKIPFRSDLSQQDAQNNDAVLSNLIDTIRNIANYPAEDFEYKVKDAIDRCLSDLVMFFPGSIKDLNTFKEGLREDLYKRINRIRSYLLNNLQNIEESYLMNNGNVNLNTKDTIKPYGDKNPTSERPVNITKPQDGATKVNYEPGNYTNGSPSYTTTPTVPRNFVMIPTESRPSIKIDNHPSKTSNVNTPNMVPKPNLSQGPRNSVTIPTESRPSIKIDNHPTQTPNVSAPNMVPKPNLSQGPDVTNNEPHIILSRNELGYLTPHQNQTNEKVTNPNDPNAYQNQQIRKSGQVQGSNVYTPNEPVPYQNSSNQNYGHAQDPGYSRKYSTSHQYQPIQKYKQVQDSQPSDFGQYEQVQDSQPSGFGQYKQVQDSQPSGFGQYKQVQDSQPYGFGQYEQGQDSQPSGFGQHKQVQDSQPSGFGLSEQVQDSQSSGFGRSEQVQDSQPSGFGRSEQVQDSQPSGFGQYKQVQDSHPSGFGQYEQVQDSQHSNFGTNDLKFQQNVPTQSVLKIGQDKRPSTSSVANQRKVSYDPNLNYGPNDTSNQNQTLQKYGESEHPSMNTTDNQPNSNIGPVPDSNYRPNDPAFYQNQTPEKYGQNQRLSISPTANAIQPNSSNEQEKDTTHTQNDSNSYQNQPLSKYEQNQRLSTNDTANQPNSNIGPVPDSNYRSNDPLSYENQQSQRYGPSERHPTVNQPNSNYDSGQDSNYRPNYPSSADSNENSNYFTNPTQSTEQPNQNYSQASNAYQSQPTSNYGQNQDSKYRSSDLHGQSDTYRNQSYIGKEPQFASTPNKNPYATPYGNESQINGPKKFNEPHRLLQGQASNAYQSQPTSNYGLNQDPKYRSSDLHGQSDMYRNQGDEPQFATTPNKDPYATPYGNESQINGPKKFNEPHRSLQGQASNAYQSQPTSNYGLNQDPKYRSSDPYGQSDMYRNQGDEPQFASTPNKDPYSTLYGNESQSNGPKKFNESHMSLQGQASNGYQSQPTSNYDLNQDPKYRSNDPYGQSDMHRNQSYIGKGPQFASTLNKDPHATPYGNESQTNGSKKFNEPHRSLQGQASNGYQSQPASNYGLNQDPKYRSNDPYGQRDMYRNQRDEPQFASTPNKGPYATPYGNESQSNGLKKFNESQGQASNGYQSQPTSNYGLNQDPKYRSSDPYGRSDMHRNQSYIGKEPQFASTLNKDPHATLYGNESQTNGPKKFNESQRSLLGQNSNTYQPTSNYGQNQDPKYRSTNPYGQSDTYRNQSYIGKEPQFASTPNKDLYATPYGNERQINKPNKVNEPHRSLQGQQKKENFGPNRAGSRDLGPRRALPDTTYNASYGQPYDKYENDKAFPDDGNYSQKIDRSNSNEIISDTSPFIKTSHSSLRCTIRSEHLCACAPDHKKLKLIIHGLKEEDMAREITDWLAKCTSIKSNGLVNRKKVIETLVFYLLPYLQKPSQCLSKPVLKAKIISVLKTLDICPPTTSHMRTLVNKLADDLANKLIGIVTRLECSGTTTLKCETKPSKPFQKLETINIGPNKVLRDDLNHDLLQEVEECFYGTKLADKKDLHQDITDLLINKVELIRETLHDVVRYDIKKILKATNKLTDDKISHTVTDIIHNPKDVVMMENNIKNIQNFTARPCLSSALVYTSQNDISPSFAAVGSSTPKKKNNVDKLSPEEKQYTDKITSIIREWIKKKPQHFEKLRNNEMNEIMINDLAGQIVDHVKLAQLIPELNFKLVKIMIYFINKCLFKFEIIDNLLEAEPYTKDLVKELQKVNVPKLTRPQQGSRQAMKNIQHNEIMDLEDSFVPTAQDIYEDEISIWMNEQPSDVFAEKDKSIQDKLIHSFAEKIKNKLENKKSSNEIQEEIKSWLKKVVKQKESKQIDSMCESLRERISKLPNVVKNIKTQPNEKGFQNASQTVCDKTMKGIIMRYVDHNYETDDSLAKAAYADLLKRELQRLSPILRKEVYEGKSLKQFAPEKLNKELEFVKDISDWLKTLPLDKDYNRAGNENRADFIVTLAKEIAEVENERLYMPQMDDDSYSNYLAQGIFRSMQQLPLNLVASENISEYIFSLLRIVFDKRQNLCVSMNRTCGSPDLSRQTWDNLADFLDDYLRMNGQDIANDELKLEVWATRLLKEIKNMVAENPNILKEPDVKDRLAAVAKPGDETIARFQHELDFAQEVSDWLKNLPLIGPVDKEIITDLAEKMSELEKQTEKSELAEYMKQWISQLPLDNEKPIDMSFFTQQLLNRMKKVTENKEASSFMHFNKTKSNDSARSRRNGCGGKVQCRGCCSVDEPGTVLVQVIQKWLQGLPLFGEAENVSYIQKDIAAKLYQTISEISDDPILAGDDEAYLKAVSERLNELLNNLSSDVSLNGDRNEIKGDLLKNLQQARLFLKEIALGDDYLKDLLNTIEKASPNTILSKDVDPGFELYKENIAEMFVLQNFDHAHDADKLKYEQLRKNEIQKFTSIAQQRIRIPTTDDKLFNDSFGALYKIDMPEEIAMIDNVEEIKTKCEIEDWLRKLPLQSVCEPAILLEQDQRLRLLARKVHILEFETDSADKIRKEIIKFLTKLHFVPGEETKINQFANDLQRILKTTQESRKCVTASDVIKKSKDLKESRNKENKSKIETQFEEDNGIWVHPNVVIGPTTQLHQPPRCKSGDVLLCIIEKWCNKVPFPSTLAPDQLKRVRDDITTRLIKKISELNSDPSTFNNNRLYNHLMEQEIDKALAAVPQVESLQQSKDVLKNELIFSIESVRPLILQERAQHEYKKDLESTFKNFIGLPDNPTSKNKAALLKLQDDLVNDFIEYQFNKNDEAGKQFYKDRMLNALTKYNTTIGEKGVMNEILADTLVETNRLICELSKIPTPEEPALKNEVEEIRMNKELERFFNKVSQNKNQSDDNERILLRKSLAKQLCEIEKTSHNVKNDEQMKMAIIRTLKKLGVNDNDDEVKAFIERLKNNEHIRKAPAYENKLENFNSNCGGPTCVGTQGQPFQRRPPSPSQALKPLMGFPPVDSLSFDQHCVQQQVDVTVHRPNYVPRKDQYRPQPNQDLIVVMPGNSLPPSPGPTVSSEIPCSFRPGASPTPQMGPTCSLQTGIAQIPTFNPGVSPTDIRPPAKAYGQQMPSDHQIPTSEAVQFPATNENSDEDECYCPMFPPHMLPYSYPYMNPYYGNFGSCEDIFPMMPPMPPRMPRMMPPYYMY